MRLPFIGPAYRTRGVGQSAQRSVNCFLERTERGGRTEATLYGTPGLILRATVGTGPIRGEIVVDSFNYVVSGNEVYKVSTGFTSTLLGTIGSATGRVSMTANRTQILIVDGVSGYIINVAAASLTTIADTDFPDGVTWGDYLDNYFIVGGDGTERFYISELADGTIWVGTEFASAEAAPDNLTSGIVDHRELFLFGSNSGEVWYNTGNATFPIERSGNAFMETGIVAPMSLVKLDNTIIWLGGDKRGNGTVWRADGYRPVRISTHGVEFAIGGYSTISDAFAYTYQIEGHSFYVLVFPTADATWVYDAATEEWHEWLAFSNGAFKRHRSNCVAFFNGEHIVGDYENGKLYALDLDTYTDNGATIKRLRSTVADDNDLKRVFYHSLQLDLEAGVGLATGQGSDPVMMLRFSNDRGNTWSNELTATVGKIGEYGSRCKWNRLGAGRSRVWEISLTDPVKFIVYGASVNATVGET
jgi:hypothetical protein